MPLDQAVQKILFITGMKFVYRIRKYRNMIRPIQINLGQFRGFHSEANYFFRVEDRNTYIEQLRTLKLVDSIVYDADRICDHQFDLLGSGDVHVGDKCPWNVDFKTNYRWKNTFYKHIAIVDLTNKADVKVPWELSRFQHVFTLGKAYWLTNDEKYAIEFQEQIEDWITHNPIEMSVNWTCTMDVAIRAVNWISGCYFFRESPSISATCWERIHASLYLHGPFILRNLENTGEHTGNHYLSNLVGLASLGIYFGEFRITENEEPTNHPKQWLEYAHSELEREMFVQVNTDGTNYEASTSYHRLVTECFLLTTVLCAHNEIYFSVEYANRLEKMCEFICQTLKPNGLTPVVGDADDGRLLIVSQYGSWVRNDYRHLLMVAGEFFDRDDFRFYAQGEEENSLWITGSFSTEFNSPSEQLRSIAFPDGGYYVLRNDYVYCLIRCGELSFRGHGAHSHNDQLSFELQINGIDFFIDPGSYVYTADYRMRNLFRSTAMHNTIEVAGKEQNDFEEDNLFLMREQSFSQCEMFTDSLFVGHHHGYRDKLGITHRRALSISENKLVILDVLAYEDTSKEQELMYIASYILSPGVIVTQFEHLLTLKRDGIIVEISYEGQEEIEVIECWVSSRYGVREASQCIQVRGTSLTMKTKVQWSSRAITDDRIHHCGDKVYI
ncbi:alginate lyase family protein [Paenibacillus sp. CMAA1364]